MTVVQRPSWRLGLRPYRSCAPRSYPGSPPQTESV